MNNPTNFLLGLYHFNLLIRNTLEYAYPRQSYSLIHYEERKKALEANLSDKGQIYLMMQKAGDQGKTVLEKLTDFQNTLYSQESTVIKATQDELRVDHAQHLVIYEMVIGLHQTFLDIMHGYVQNKPENVEFDFPLKDLFAADERFFRTLVFNAVMVDLEKDFLEFQKVMHESKGEKTPQSNYIVNDISRLIGFLRFEKQHNKVMDTSLNEMMDECFKVVEMVEGKRELPLPTPEQLARETPPRTTNIKGVNHLTFPEVFAELKKRNREMVVAHEIKWKSIYEPINAKIKEEYLNNRPTGKLDA